MARASRRARVAGATLRAILAIGFAADGLMRLAGIEVATASLHALGYPPELSVLVGACEVLGAALLPFRGYAALGAALLALVMLGAVGTIMMAGAPLRMVAFPLILFALLLVVIYAQRRRLRAAAETVAGA